MPSVGVPAPFGSSTTCTQIIENANKKLATPNSTGEQIDATATPYVNVLENRPTALRKGEVYAMQVNETNLYNPVRSYSLEVEESEEHYQSPAFFFLNKNTTTSENHYATRRKPM